MRILTTIDTIWLNEVLPASPHWTSQIRYEAVASLLLAPSTCAVQICFMDIIAIIEAEISCDYINVFKCSNLSVYFEVHCFDDDGAGKTKTVIHQDLCKDY